MKTKYVKMKNVCLFTIGVLLTVCNNTQLTVQAEQTEIVYNNKVVSYLGQEGTNLSDIKIVYSYKQGILQEAADGLAFIDTIAKGLSELMAMMDLEVFFCYLRSFKLAEGVGNVEKLSDEQVLSAIMNYCFTINPDLEGIINAEEYPVYWEIISSDEYELVVLFRSYTGAQIRYYINRTTGDTYVTEYVPGITTEEQRTEESFNVRDYFSGE